MTGKIPACLFSQLRNLSTLYLAANGLEGEFPEDVLTTRLSDFSIGYNKMRGKVPDQYLSKVFLSLDLSHNQFDGTLINFNLESTSENISNSVIDMSVNRFSGRFPIDVMRSYGSVDILSGSLFGCEINRESFPKTDPYRRIFSCGSSLYDYAIYLLVRVNICVASLNCITSFSRYPNSAGSSLCLLHSFCWQNIFMNALKCLP